MKTNVLAGITAIALCHSASAASPMTKETFVRLGNESVNVGRCVGGTTTEEAHRALDYALNKKLITKAAYNWGKAKGYYPVIDAINLKIGAVCKKGCFAYGTKVFTYHPEQGDSWTPIQNLSLTDKALSLSQDSTLQRFSLVENKIKHITSGYEDINLFVFHLTNGNQLKVTQNHGMLLGNGMMVEAKNVRKGDWFLTINGEKTAVTKIVREKTTQKVYNYEVVSESKVGNIVAAEGILVGDLSWQNQRKGEINSIALRNE